MHAPAAGAQNFFDMLFGGGERRAPPPASAYADPNAPRTSLTVRPRSYEGGGGSASFCVRLCDGRFFPVQRSSAAKPAQLCNSLCPASKTKVFFGSEIGRSTASDGSRYADLDNAFAYRERIVADCTCNGRDAFGTAKVDIEDDPTLKPGDLVSDGRKLIKFRGSRTAKASKSREARSPEGLRGGVAVSEARRSPRSESAERDDGFRNPNLFRR
jgi:hypothetical protein